MWVTVQVHHIPCTNIKLFGFEQKIRLYSSIIDFLEYIHKREFYDEDNPVKCCRCSKCKMCTKSSILYQEKSDFTFNNIKHDIGVVDENCLPIDMYKTFADYTDGSSNFHIYVYRLDNNPVKIDTCLVHNKHEYILSYVTTDDISVQDLYDFYLYPCCNKLVQKKKHETLFISNQYISGKAKFDSIYLNEITEKDKTIIFLVKFKSKTITSFKEYKKKREISNPCTSPISTDIFEDPDKELEQSSLDGISFDDLLALMKEKVKSQAIDSPRAKMPDHVLSEIGNKTSRPKKCKKRKKKGKKRR